MSEPTNRDRAAESLGRVLRRASLRLEPEPGSLEALVGLIVDAAKGEFWADLGEWLTHSAAIEPAPLPPHLKPIADAIWARNEAAYRHLARDGKDEHQSSAASLGDEMIAGMKAYNDAMDARRELYDEDPGRCERCGEPFELVRPGKSQPTCECWGRDIE